MTSSKPKEVLVVVVAEDVEEVEVVEALVEAAEEEVVVLRADPVEVKEAPLIHEYAFCVFNTYLVSLLSPKLKTLAEKKAKVLTPLANSNGISVLFVASKVVMCEKKRPMV